MLRLLLRRKAAYNAYEYAIQAPVGRVQFHVCGHQAKEEVMQLTTLYITVGALVMCSASGATFGADRLASQPLTGDQRQVTEGSNAFAVDLYAQLRRQKGNLFFSPFSLSTALAMTYGGARGQTASQMADVLHFPPDQDRLHHALAETIQALNAAGQSGDYQLSIANALWGQEGHVFLPAFVDLAQRDYGAGLFNVDFAATAAASARINAWVEKQTQDKIRDLIQPGMLNSQTVLVLTNAIYFKGFWATAFPRKNTKTEPFYMAAGKTVSVPMMHLQDGSFRYIQKDNFWILEMPYKGNSLSMIILLPYEESAPQSRPAGPVQAQQPAAYPNLETVEPSITPGRLQDWLRDLDAQPPRKLPVYLPRFKITWEGELSRTLADMGMKDAFSGSADFRGMDGKRDICISKVVHKAFVDVNEEGTEAAAASAVIGRMMATRQLTPPPIFRADHPFVFMIRDNRHAVILFAGRVLNPQE